MAVPHSRLASLPGYDTSPDVYETPDLVGSTSTTSESLPTSPRSQEDASSATSDTDSDNSNAAHGGVSRRRIKVGRARERFTRQGNGRGVEVRAGDFSDRVGGYRKGYRLTEGRSSGRGQGGYGGQEDESLEQRIARLRREVEECRVEAGKARKGENGHDKDEQEGGLDGSREEMDDLRRLIDGLDAGRPRYRGDDAHGRTDRDVQDSRESEGDTLRKVAAFDTRLEALERTLGPLDASAASAPVMPTLQLLDEQLSALTTATSLASLEAASARIRKLREEAEQVSHDSVATTNVAEDPTSEIPQDAISQEAQAALKSLHSLVPNLNSLSPIVPALLGRLHSLRTLHAGAANAASELEDLERRQEELDSEMKAWREGLERVEGQVREADEANGRNGKVVQGWVRELEGRVEKLR